MIKCQHFSSSTVNPFNLSAYLEFSHSSILTENQPNLQQKPEDYTDSTATHLYKHLKDKTNPSNPQYHPKKLKFTISTHLQPRQLKTHNPTLTKAYHAQESHISNRSNQYYSNKKMKSQPIQLIPNSKFTNSSTQSIAQSSSQYKPTSIKKERSNRLNSEAQNPKRPSSE